MPKPDLSTPNLQVALDLIDLDKALEIARMAWDNGADILEAGTPLIKSEGLRAVKILRKEFPDAIIVADMKTVDVGNLEVELAANAGADIITVMGFSWNSTIKAAIEAARKYDVLVEADLMYVENPIERALELKNLGVDIIGIHVGIDVQKERGITASALLEEVRRIVSIYGNNVSVAGGLREDNVEDVVRAGARIIVVGSAITKSKNPGDATHRIKEAILRVLREG